MRYSSQKTYKKISNQREFCLRLTKPAAARSRPRKKIAGTCRKNSAVQFRGERDFPEDRPRRLLYHRKPVKTWKREKHGYIIQYFASGLYTCIRIRAIRNSTKTIFDMSYRANIIAMIAMTSSRGEVYA